MTKTSSFDRAISSHLDWLDRFQNLLDGNSSEVIDPEHVRNDTTCEFGKWFHGNQGDFDDAELYNRIKELHRAFHEHAAKIGSMFNNNGNNLDIEASLFHLQESSRSLIAALQQAKQQSEDHDTD